MKEQLDVLGRNSIKDDNLEERPELRFQGFNENWKHEKIGELFDERSEKGYETLDLLSVTINNGVIKRKDIDAKDNSSANKSNYKKVLPNDIVYNSMRMWQGASGKSEFEGIVSPAYTILIPKNVDSDFIGYLFKKETTLYQFRKYSQGLTSDTWNLKYPLISQIKINVPDLKEQIKIRNFLRCVDKKIVFMQKTLSLYQKLEEKIRKDIFNFKENLIDFKKHTLEDIADIRKGFTPSTQNEEYWENGTYKWLSIADMDKKYLSESSKKITAEAIKHKNIIPKDTLIMSFKLSIGKLAILKEPMFTNEAIANFTWKTENISTEYMYYYLKTINILKYGSQAAKGVTLNNDSLNSIPILLPSYENQKEIVKLLKVFEMKIELIKSKLEKEKEFKKGILQKMFI